MELLQRVAQQRVVRPVERIDAREDQRPGLLVARQRVGRRAGGRRQGVAHLAVADALEARRDVAHLARAHDLDRHQLRPEHAQLDDVQLDARLHQPDVLARVERALGEADIGDHALVGVVVGVEDEAPERARPDRPWAPARARRWPPGPGRCWCPPWPTRG